uniref:Uncharacterized protein n=1 Tax=Anguilla anguilla TaxID=7936 RepID=A0A0E9TYH4_ANGAN
MGTGTRAQNMGYANTLLLFFVRRFRLVLILSEFLVHVSCEN